MPEAEQRLCWRKNREVRAHLTLTGLGVELSFSLTLQCLEYPGRKECLLLPVFTSFPLNGFIGFPLHAQREERKAKTYNCFRLFPLSSNTDVGLGTAGSLPDFQLNFPSALRCRFIYASAFWNSSPSPLSASLITRWFLQPVFSQLLGQH